MSKLYLGGVPTELEVRALREKYQSLKIGDKVPHDDIEALIGAQRRTSRYMAVVNRWRNLEEKEHGIVIGPDTPNGYKVLSDKEKLTLSTSKLKSAGRFAYRSRKVAERIDVSNLTEEQRKDFDHSNKTAAAIIMASRLKPVAELPEL